MKLPDSVAAAAVLPLQKHRKFMTNEILLKKIQSDLLLRKYGAVVIDEAHEQNLNTDNSSGVLNVMLPLRRKAAKELVESCLG